MGLRLRPGRAVTLLTNRPLWNIAARSLLRRASWPTARGRRPCALAHQVLDLFHLILPAPAAEEAQQCAVDRLRTFKVTHLAVGFGGLLAELEQLIRLIASERIQIDAIDGVVKVLSGFTDIA